MSVDFEVSGRRGQLELAWLRANYSDEQLQRALEAIQASGRRGFPANVAQALHRAGGPKLPSGSQLESEAPDAAERKAKHWADVKARLANLRCRLGR